MSTPPIGSLSELQELCPYTILNMCKNNLGEDTEFYAQLLGYNTPQPKKLIAPIKKFNAAGNLSCYVALSLRKINNNYEGPCCQIQTTTNTDIYFDKTTGLMDTTGLDSFKDNIKIVKIYNQMCSSDTKRCKKDIFEFATLTNCFLKKTVNNFYYIKWDKSGSMIYNFDDKLIDDSHENINNPAFSISSYFYNNKTQKSSDFSLSLTTDNTLLSTKYNTDCISMSYSYDNSSVNNSYNNFNINNKNVNSLFYYNTTKGDTSVVLSDNNNTKSSSSCPTTIDYTQNPENGIYISFDSSGGTLSELLLFMKDDIKLSDTDFNNIVQDCTVWTQTIYTTPDPKCDSVVPYICNNKNYGENEICGCYSNNSFVDNLESDLVNTDRWCIDPNCSSDNAYKSIHSDSSLCSSICTSVLDIETQKYGIVNIDNVQMSSNCTNKADIDSIIYCGDGDTKCTDNETCMNIGNGYECVKKKSILSNKKCKDQFPVVIVSNDGKSSKCVSRYTSISSCQNNKNCDNGTYCNTQYSKCFPNTPKSITLDIILIGVGIILLCYILLFLYTKVKSIPFKINFKNITIILFISVCVVSIYYLNRPEGVELYTKPIGSNICTKDSQIVINNQCMCKVGYLYDKETDKCIKLDETTPYICNTLSYLPDPIYTGYVLYSTVINNDIYVFTSSNNVFKWNMYGMTWDIQSNYLNNYLSYYVNIGQTITEPVINSNSFFTYKNKVYIYFNNKVSGSIYVYDPKISNTENQIIYNNIKGVTLDDGTGQNNNITDIVLCISNNYIYLFGGYDNIINKINYYIYVYNLDALNNNSNPTPYSFNIPNLNFKNTGTSRIYCDDQVNKLYLYNVNRANINQDSSKNNNSIYIFDTSEISNNNFQILSKTDISNNTSLPISRYYVYKNKKYIILYFCNNNIEVYEIGNNINPIQIFIKHNTVLYKYLFSAFNKSSLCGNSFKQKNIKDINYTTFIDTYTTFTINEFFFVINNTGVIMKVDFTNKDISGTNNSLIINPCYPIGSTTINNNYNNKDNFITFYNNSNYTGTYISLPYNYNYIYIINNTDSCFNNKTFQNSNYNVINVAQMLPQTDTSGIKSIKFGNNINTPEYVYFFNTPCKIPFNNTRFFKSPTSNLYNILNNNIITYICFNPDLLYNN